MTFSSYSTELQYIHRIIDNFVLFAPKNKLVSKKCSKFVTCLILKWIMEILTCIHTFIYTYNGLISRVRFLVVGRFPLKKNPREYVRALPSLLEPSASPLNLTRQKIYNALHKSFLS